jgi:phosphoribosyl-AMP cyclohydrolase
MIKEPDFSRSINGLLPAIAQDSQSNQVLMFAWMNEEAFRETVASGYATYFSRSRNRLWRKGEESGHRQRVIEIRVDCDADCILIKVEQIGAACHEGYASCFFRKLNNGEFTVDQQRIVNPDDVYPSAATT